MRAGYVAVCLGHRPAGGPAHLGGAFRVGRRGSYVLGVPYGLVAAAEQDERGGQGGFQRLVPGVAGGQVVDGEAQ